MLFAFTMQESRLRGVFNQRGVVAEQEELPERLLGTCRLEHLDLSAAAHLEISTGSITRKVEG